MNEQKKSLVQGQTTLSEELKAFLNDDETQWQAKPTAELMRDAARMLQIQYQYREDSIIPVEHILQCAQIMATVTLYRAVDRVALAIEESKR